jgi:hypothetical protein
MKILFLYNNEIKTLLDTFKQTGIGLIVMMLGIIMMVIPFIVIRAEKPDKTIIEITIQIVLPIIGLLFLLFSFPIILRSKKDRNLKT